MSSLIVHHLPGAWGLISVSPFCLKLDAFLKMTGIEHESVTANAPFGAPKGKAPWMKHGNLTMGDSTLIILYLKEKFGIDPDSALSAEQRGQSLAMQRMIEENLYWAMVYDRWVRPENWSMLKSTVLSGIPAIPRALIAPIARRGVKRQLKGHGLGIHTGKEIAAIGKRDIDAIAAMLGEKPFLHGDTPTEIDACAYSLLANIHSVGFASPLKTVIAGHKNLLAFIARFQNRFYPA